MTVANIPYAVWMAAGVLGCFALFALSVKKAGLPGRTAWISLVPAIILAFLCAKGVYLLFFFRQHWARYGLGALTALRADTFSFAGGAIGAALGVSLIARLLRLPPGRILDAFAPVGCLLVALFRLLESLLGTLGAGPQILPPHWAIGTPLSLVNRWGEVYWAIHTMEAGFAALCCLTCVSPPLKCEGRFRRSALILCAGQLFFEVLRANTISYHFVRIDQALCALVLLCAAWKTPERPRRARRVLGLILLTALNGYVQFVLDKPYLLTDWLPAALQEPTAAHIRPICLAVIALCAGLSALCAGLTDRSPCPAPAENTPERP